MVQILLSFAVLAGGVIIYVWLLNRAMSVTPQDAQKLVDKPWTEEDIRSVYERMKQSPIEVKAFLKPRTGRRYIVLGGAGMVGSWIVQHLLWRGEDPEAIRILDLQAPKRPEVTNNNIRFIQTDVTSKESLDTAFKFPWPGHMEDSPLTVFHCVAYIAFRERYSIFLPRYLKVNVEGTRNVITAAKAAGATILVATATGGIGPKPPSFFMWPWQKHPKDIFQVLAVAKTREQDPLNVMVNCYAYSKAQAEMLVVTSHDPKNNFYTGCVRPCYGIYAHHAASPANLVWDYLKRGGTPSWLHGTVGHFIDAENVSIAHLAYEHTLLKQHNVESTNFVEDLGGKTYFITDPNPPITYAYLYKLLATLAHPSTTPKFPVIPPGLLLIFAHLIEFYELIWSKYLSSVLPPLPEDLANLQPGTFNVSAGHYIFDDSDARRDIGYVAPIRTIEGFARVVMDWNEKVEEELRESERLTGLPELAVEAAETEVKADTINIGLPKAF